MKFSPNLSTSLAAGAFLLAGSFALAQTTSAARNMHPGDAASGHVSNMQAQPGAMNVQQYREAEDMTTRYRPGNNKTTRSANDAAAQGADAAQPQSTPKKHIAGVKYEDRVAGNNPDGTAGHSTHDVVQRKSGSIVLLNDKGTERTDRNSAHATESLRTSDNARTGENPLYEGGGKSGTNPLYESGKRQSAVTSGNPGPSIEAQSKKHLGNVKYQDRMSGGGNSAHGMAVNEQGSTTARPRRRR